MYMGKVSVLQCLSSCVSGLPWNESIHLLSCRTGTLTRGTKYSGLARISQTVNNKKSAEKKTARINSPKMISGKHIKEDVKISILIHLNTNNYINTKEKIRTGNDNDRISLSAPASKHLDQIWGGRTRRSGLGVLGGVRYFQEIAGLLGQNGCW